MKTIGLTFPKKRKPRESPKKPPRGQESREEQP